MSSRDLAELGESTLSLLAAARGIIAQRVSKDVSGWDFLLEFEIEVELSELGEPMPADLCRPPLKCFVQVKATDEAEKFSVKLSAARRLALTLLPAFFLLLRFRGGQVAQEAFLVPVDRELLAMILKRVREADVEEQSLSDLFLKISPSPSHSIPMTGEGLESAIRANVGREYWNYGRVKEQWIDSVGYEEGGRTFSFDLVSGRENNLSESLAELAIGMRSSIPIENVRIDDHRFGVSAKRPVAEAAVGHLEATPISQECDVTLRLGPRFVRVGGQLYLPHGLVGVVEDRHLKYRFKHEYFEMVVSRQSLTATWTLPGTDVPSRLDKLGELASILELTAESSEGSSKVELWIASEGNEWCVGTIELPPPPEGIPELARAIQDARALSRYLDLGDQIKVELNRLIAQRIRLRFLRAIIDPSGPGVEVSLSESSGAALEGKRVCFVQTVEAELGGSRAYLLVACKGRIQRRSERGPGRTRYILESPEKRIVKKLIAPVAEPQIDQEKFEADLVEAVEEGVIVIKQGSGSADSGGHQSPE